MDRHCHTDDVFSFLFGGGGGTPPRPHTNLKSDYGNPYDSNGVYVFSTYVYGSALGDQPVPAPPFIFRVSAFDFSLGSPRVSATVAARTTAILSANNEYQGSKKQLWDHQSNMAFTESILPGGSVLIGGDYRPSAVISATADVGLDRALDFLAGITAVLQKVRSATGIPMSVASKAVTRLGTALNALSLYNAVKAMQNEYQACMDF
jgi:hypothetical protein